MKRILLLATLSVGCGTGVQQVVDAAMPTDNDSGTDAGVAINPPDEVVVPGGEAGIGFDDLRYSANLHRILVPGGRAGVIALVNPDDGSVDTIGGFSTAPTYTGGHDFGVTSADESGGLIAATDRTSRKLVIADPKTMSIVSSVKLGGPPDYVRWVSTTHEVWVTEPGIEQIEIFSVPTTGTPTPSRVATISVPNGPESIVVDAKHGRAYTHHWDTSSVAIDVSTRKIAAEWPNGCTASRGIDVDPELQLLFAACAEGKMSVIATDTGDLLSTVSQGSGYDVMGYAPALKRAYAAGSCKCVTTFAFADGKLAAAQKQPAPLDAHCAVADDVGSVWICSPKTGSIIRRDGR